jgi:hypothetical protein
LVDFQPLRDSDRFVRKQPSRCVRERVFGVFALQLRWPDYSIVEAVPVGDFAVRFNSSIPTICRPEAAFEQLPHVVHVDVFRSDMLRQAARPK